MITSDDAERAIDFFRTKAPKLAQARADRVYMTEWVKVVKAKQMQQHPSFSAAAQEREALASPEYEAALLALKMAVLEDEKMRWQATGAEAQIEAWRSQEASRRAEGKATA